MKRDNAVIKERLKILYQGAFFNNSADTFAVILFSYIYSQQFDLVISLLWIGFMLSVLLLRYKLIFNYKKNEHDISNHKRYENSYVYLTSLFSCGLAFLIAFGLFLPAPFNLYSLLLLIAAISVAIPLYNSSKKCVYFYITPMLISAIPLLLFQGGDETIIGIVVVLFSIMVVRSIIILNNTLINTFESRNYAQELAENLTLLQNEKSVREQLMQDLTDNTPAVIYIKDIDGKFTFVNQEFLKLFHLQRKDIIDKTLHDVFPNEIAEEMRSNDLEVQKEKRPLKYEETAPQDDGLHHYISVKFPLFDETGKLYAVAGVSTDTTERFRVKESLDISQQRLLLHREQSPVGVIEWNTDFEFLDWNPAAEKIFGYTKEEVQGHHITERILPQSARTAVDEVWKELLTNTGGYYSLNQNTTKDGRTILCEWHNTPLVDNNGKVIGVTSLVDDVTQRQRDEEDIRQSQKMDAIGKLTGGIAHDFNNMLGVILGYSELIKVRVNENEQTVISYTDEIIKASERAKKLTSKLLDFSRKAPSSEEVTHVNELLNGMQDLLKKTLTARIDLVLEKEKNLWPVWLDKTRLEDSILNISINAMHAMPDGGSLTLSSHNLHLKESDSHKIDIPPGDYVQLLIKDTGIGMSSEIQQQIFDPFFTTKGSEGTGLGLSQVYGFVQQSGGKIKVYSQPGQGTSIELYLPRHKGSEGTSTEETSTGSLLLPSGQETVLVVDDEIALLDLAEENLTTYSYTVFRAENAEQALDILKTQTIDLLLSDVIMPGMDGYQLASEVERLYPKVKIQMISGFTDESNTKLDNDRLHQQRLHKPYNLEDLLRRIRKLLDE